jgi:hypothetical protein
MNCQLSRLNGVVVFRKAGGRRPVIPNERSESRDLHLYRISTRH